MLPTSQRFTTISDAHYTETYIMFNIIPFQFESQEIEVVVIDEQPWFNASQVAKALGYQNTSKAIRDNVPNSETRKIPMNRPGCQPLFVSEDGCSYLVANSKMPKAVGVASALGLPAMKTTKEQETISVIMEAFQHEHPVPQFFVNGYRIDLYFPSCRLAVECDEEGHKDYGQYEEKERQENIERALGCNFIRYNPDLPGFNIGTVINQIICYLYAA